jgi:hypothetical protein
MRIYKIDLCRYRLEARANKIQENDNKRVNKCTEKFSENLVIADRKLLTYLLYSVARTSYKNRKNVSRKQSP